jgi:beta-galactosidase
MVADDRQRVNDWENPRVVGRNKLAAHVPLVSFPSEGAALRLGAERSPDRRLLNGDWYFHWSPNPDAAPDAFFGADYDDSGWDTLPVPANWQLHGYDVPMYTNVQYPFPIDDLPGVPHDDNRWAATARPSRCLQNGGAQHPPGVRRRGIGVLRLGERPGGGL